jgi:capsular polysaccharide biosynthesis protein
MGIEIAPSDPGLEGNPMAEGGRDEFTGAILGVRELKSALRRRRRMWLGTAAAGLLVGAALHVVVPRSYKAISNLYLVEAPGSSPSAAMANEVSLLQTRAVAQQAASLLPDHRSTQSVASSYKGLASSGSILSVIAKAKSPADAVALDNAVAKAFLGVRSDELKRETGIVVAGLQSQIGSLRGQTNPSDQISQLQSGISAAELGSRSSIDGSFVLDPGAAVRVSTKKATVLDMLAGLIAGLAVGCGFVLIKEMLSDRARRREDVGAALGVNIELSVARSRSRPTARWRRKAGRPGSTATMIERRLRAHLDSAPDRSLAVFVVEAERVAALAISQLAASLASEGRTVVLLDMAKGRPIARLFHLKARREPLHRVDLHGHSFTAVVTPDDPAQGVGSLDQAPFDDVLVLASLDPALGVEHVATWAREAVAIVRAGKATHVGLNGASRMIRQAGIALRSAILVGADPDDDSVGLSDSEAVPTEGRPAADALPAGHS